MDTISHRPTARVIAVALLGLVLSLLPAPDAPAQAESEFAWRLVPTGTTARLRGLDAISHSSAWASGSEATVVRTLDGGASWENVSPPGTGDLQFRDIEAFDRDHATILSIGSGEESRIYQTADGGATWNLVFVNEDELAFYDCMTFFNRRQGLALSDPVDGKFRILATSDGGGSWQVVPNDGMPPALAGEFAFAASGTCLVSGPGRNAWFGTGGGAEARVFHSEDGGTNWTVASTPMQSNGSSGIFSLAFLDDRHGLAVGGDFLQPDLAVDAAARTADGGATWTLIGADAPHGYRSGSAWIPRVSRTALAVGPTGSDVSVDGGRSWTLFDTGSFDSVDCSTDGACWASGEAGRAAKLVTSP